MKKASYKFHPEILIRNLAILLLILLGAALIIFAIANAPKSPIEQWHEAAESGMTWQEYTERD